MNREAFKLAHETLRKAVREYGWWRHATEYKSPDGIYRRYHAPLGKFEGEHWSIVHFYDAVMDGCGDEPLYEDETIAADLLEVSDVEREAFKFAPNTGFVALWCSGQGFVSMQELTAEEYDRLREDYAADNFEEDSQA